MLEQCLQEQQASVGGTPDRVREPHYAEVDIGNRDLQVSGKHDVGQVVAQVVRDQFSHFLLFLRETAQGVT